jgi:hypothetical protein
MIGFDADMCKKAMRILGTVAIVMVVLGLVLGCTSESTSQPTASSLPTVVPEPTEPFASILPTPEALTSVLPTPDPGWATVVGMLVGSTGGQRVASTVVFLERTPREQTVPPVLYAPPNDQPSAMTDDAGRFVISEVPDGEYVIVAFAPPFDPQIVTDPSSGQPVFVMAQMGKLIDVGAVGVLDF